MYIGIDLGGTNIAAGLVDEKGTVIAKKSIPTLASRPVDEIIKDMADLALSITAENGLSPKDVEWVGIGSPGTVDNGRGMIVYANNIGFRETPISEIFQKTWDIPVYLGNDADCAALGEAHAGAAKGCSSAIMITLGTGLGGGIIINKKIYSGFNCAGGELGHMCIVYDGQPCTCGRKGCWEAYSSATALIRMTSEAMLADTDHKSLLWTMHDARIESISGKSAFRAADAGDKIAAEVLDRYFKYLACGISNIINIFQPEVLVIGGGISKEGEKLTAPIRALVSNEIYTRGVPQTQIKTATLGNDAGIVGAAMLGK